MGSSRKVAQREETQLHLELLPSATRRALVRCAAATFFARGGWYLAGGTALALQAGHRQSVDLDFFNPKKTFNEISVERALLKIGAWRTSYREAGTVYGTLMNAKMSLIAYPFFVPASEEIRFGAVRILSSSDIAAMKVIAISQRGRKRDFVDLYWYCTKSEPLLSVIERAVRQYPGQKHNLPHFLKSLTYFADAEDDPMPKLFFRASWPEIRRHFEREVPRIGRQLLGLTK